MRMDTHNVKQKREHKHVQYMSKITRENYTDKQKYTLQKTMVLWIYGVSSGETVLHIQMYSHSIHLLNNYLI